MDKCLPFASQSQAPVFPKILRKKDGLSVRVRNCKHILEWTLVGLNIKNLKIIFLELAPKVRKFN